MPKLRPKQLERVQADYEVRGMSHSELAKKHHTPRTTIRDHIKKHGWIKNKTAALVEQKAHHLDALEVLDEKTAKMNAPCIEAVTEQVNYLREFQQAALDNQSQANDIIKNKSDLNLMDLNTHSQITARNKETVLGKLPETKIDINNQAQQPVNIQVIGISPEQQAQLDRINKRADAGLG